MKYKKFFIILFHLSSGDFVVPFLFGSSLPDHYTVPCTQPIPIRTSSLSSETFKLKYGSQFRKRQRERKEGGKKKNKEFLRVDQQERTGFNFKSIAFVGDYSCGIKVQVPYCIKDPSCKLNPQNKNTFKKMSISKTTSLLIVKGNNVQDLILVRVLIE